MQEHVRVSEVVDTTSQPSGVHSPANHRKHVPLLVALGRAGTRGSPTSTTVSSASRRRSQLLSTRARTTRAPRVTLAACGDVAYDARPTCGGGVAMASPSTGLEEIDP